MTASIAPTARPYLKPDATPWAVLRPRFRGRGSAPLRGAPWGDGEPTPGQYERECWGFAYRVTCSRFVQHPCRQKCERAVRLQDDRHLHVIRDEPSSDDNGLTELRMERIVDLGF